MKTSPRGLELIESFESLRLTAYWDGTYLDQAKTQKRWSIGWGHTGGVKEFNTCTPEQAEVWQAEDVAEAEDSIGSLVKVPLTQNQFDALASFVFNVGSGAFENSTLLKLLNAGSYQLAAIEFPRWDHDNGQVSAGLLRRRDAEQELFRESA